VIHSQRRQLTWKAPSRDEHDALVPTAENELIAASAFPPSVPVRREVQGSRARGLIIHKLFEEVLSGETAGGEEALPQRADELIRGLGSEPSSSAAEGLSSAEIASCVNTTLLLPKLVAVRQSLAAEIPLFSVVDEDGDEIVTVGIVDAVSMLPNEDVRTVIDWKSDVAPRAETIEAYRAQEQGYLSCLKGSGGMLVFVTTGTIVSA
jgi:hypothetical protein